MLETLIAARNLIADAPALSRGSYMKVGDTGLRVGRSTVIPPNACFCILGAIAVAKDISAMNAHETDEAKFLAKAIDRGIGHPFDVITHFSDNHTQADVLALLDKVIAS